ncbi:MAG: hypothetical protein IKE29_10520, partial [Paenibacillus sp.]|nr:hypothetical protein [Paenibacillus sp.]
MQVALYVYRIGAEWSMEISLDIRVDVVWWLEYVSGQRVSQWLVLSMQLPLSQASWLVDQFVSVRTMNQWQIEEWQRYFSAKLDFYNQASGETEVRNMWNEQEGVKRWSESERGRGNRQNGIRTGNLTEKGNEKRLEKRTEKSAGGKLEKGTKIDHETVVAEAVTIGGMPQAYPAEHWAQLEQCAALLAERMSGRQLLAAEVEALLAAEPAMPPGGWRAAAQLACLRGRLQMTAALEGPATRHRLAWLGRA